MIRLSKTLVLALLMVASVTTLVNCSPTGKTLDGTQWKLVGWTLSSLTPDKFNITAKFDGGRISGHNGVNTYSGSYTLGSGDDFSTGDLVSTKMAGEPDAMQAETTYMNLLSKAKSCKRDGKKLTLYDKAGNESLIFEETGK